VVSVSGERTQLHHLVRETARWRGEQPALTFGDSTLSYAELWDEIVRFAAALRRSGVRRGDRLAVYLDKQLETVVAMFGAAAAGAVFVPVNPLLRPAQVCHVLTDCAVRILVTSVERLEPLREELDRCEELERAILVGEATPRPGEGLRQEVATWHEFVAGELTAAGADDGIDLDVAAVFYTSGSTGRPKGVVLSHRNLVAGAESVVSYLGNDGEDRILALLPLSFDAGFSQLTTGFAAGAHVVLANYLLPADVVRLCAQHGISGLTCVPPLWIRLAAQEWPPEATATMRYFASTGGRMPRATLERLRQIFAAAEPFLMYGLTEAFRSTYLDPGEVDRRPDSIGKAIPNAEIFVAAEDGTRCPPGEPGELVHRGALVALGYWNDPEATAERFRPAPSRDPALCTPEIAVWSGDLVVEDEQGFLSFVGRRDEMIKTSGYRVSPAEVEEAAYDTGLVGDAVAIGVDDPELGQQIVLAVSPAADPGAFEPDALLAAMRRRLPRFMLPKRVEAMPELPRSPNGKFDRASIRGELAGDE
jgi:acyl-CoA ligase (AMP-forming) (exosortase A-associated)